MGIDCNPTGFQIKSFSRILLGKDIWHPGAKGTKGARPRTAEGRFWIFVTRTLVAVGVGSSIKSESA